MAKSVDAFRSIGEVAQLIGVAPHVLRYWETQFPQLAPVKRADGRRYYRPDDVRLAAGLCEVMREDGMTARGAARLIALDKGAALRERGAAKLAALIDAQANPPAKPARAQRAARLRKPAAEQPRSSLPLFADAHEVPADALAPALVEAAPPAVADDRAVVAHPPRPSVPGAAVFPVPPPRSAPLPDRIRAIPPDHPVLADLPGLADRLRLLIAARVAPGA